MYGAEFVWAGVGVVWCGAKRDAKRGESEGRASLFFPPPPPKISNLKSHIFSLLTQPFLILRLKSLSFAEPDPVHGNWSEWTPYTGCSESCGGIKTRSRNCTNPAPAFNGTQCLGHSSEDVKCPNNCSGQCNYHSVFFLFFFFFFFFLFHIVLNLIFPAWKIKLNIKLEKIEKSQKVDTQRSLWQLWTSH